ncbi:MAG: carboxypeptidase regulatory-like domain-containing protein, partial [Chloroflexota bacterium]
LRILRLESNQLADLPSEIGQLSKLEYLNVSFNALESLPDEISELSELNSLLLSHNNIVDLPPTIEQMRGVQYLDLSHNQFKEMPTGLDNHGHFRFNLEFNELEIFPQTIANVNRYGEVYLNNNPLNDRLPIFEPGTGAIFSFYQTGLCMPESPEFTSWLSANSELTMGTGLTCGQSFGGIKGVVIDENGEPVPNSIVNLYQLPPSSYFLRPEPLIDSTITAQDGSYEFGDMGDGIEYALYVISPDSTFPSQYSNSGWIYSSKRVSVTHGTIKENVDIELMPRLIPNVMVASEKGSISYHPFSEPQLGEFYIVQDTHNRSDITVTAEVVCQDLSTPTNVMLTIGYEGYPRFAMSSMTNNQYSGTMFKESLESGEIYIEAECEGDVEFTLLGGITIYEPTGEIIDIVTKQPVENASVTLYHVPDWTVRKNRADNRPNTCESNNSKTFDVGWSQAAPEELGQPANAKNLDAVPPINHQITDDAGTFSWELEDACWYVVVEAEGYETLVSPVVGESSLITDLNLELSPKTEFLVTGRVVDQSGNPIEGVLVTAQAQTKAYANASTSTDANGEYTLTLLNGTYMITFEKAGYDFSGLNTEITINGVDQVIENITAPSLANQGDNNFFLPLILSP